MLKYLLIFLPHLLIAQGGVSVIEGFIINSQTHKPITEAIIFMPNNSYSTGVNKEGSFRTVYPNIDADSSIIFTCMGCSVYKTTPRELSLNANKTISLDSLDHLDISLGMSDAKVLVQAALDSIGTNYSSSPYFQNGFFLGSVELDKLGFVKINEAAVRTERFPEEKEEKQKSKLLQSRKFEWSGQSSKIEGFALSDAFEVVTRSIDLDIPDFLSKKGLKSYEFNIDSLLVPFIDKAVYAVSFKPEKENLSGGRIGKIYIDPDTKAILRIEYSMTEKGMTEIFKTGFGNIKISGNFIHSTTQMIPFGKKWVLGNNEITFNALFEDRLDKKFKTLGDIHLRYQNMETGNLKRSSIREMEEAMRTTSFSESNSYSEGFWRRENYLIPTLKMQEIVVNKLSKNE